MRPPQTSILIPTLNAGTGFQDTLQAIARQRIDDPFEIVIVDSGSSDKTVEHGLTAGAVVHSIPPEEFGHGRTRNMLAGLARGEKLVFLTQDALPASDLWLSLLLAGLDEPQVAACFGRQIPRPGASLLQVHHLAWWYPDQPARWSLQAMTDVRINKLFYSHVNAACKREIWETVRFDESIVMSEDQEWSRRTLLNGWEIRYVPEAAVIHSHQYGLAQAFRRHFDSGASLAAITADNDGDWFRRGMAYLSSEIRFLSARRAFLTIPYALVFEAARYVGFTLGRRHRWIPRWIKMRLGEHGPVWSRLPSAQSGPAPTTN